MVDLVERHGEPRVEVRRSSRRRRTVSARREGDTVVVLVPAGMSAAEEQRWVTTMLRRLERGEQRRRSGGSRTDESLAQRCAELSRRHLDGRARPSSVRWVRPMRTRWASATPGDGSIRVSERLKETPAWVLDYVLVHELAHLLVPGHGRDFWALVRHYPRTDRAIGYLEGLSAAAGLDMTGTDGDDPDDLD